MKTSEKQQYITNFVATNGGRIQKERLMAELFRLGVVSGQNDFDGLVEKLVKHGYLKFEEEHVVYVKTKKAIPSFEDMFINKGSKVKGDVSLPPNGVNSNPTLLP
ncbi:MAG: hypothetical protein Q4F05_17975 [bacterium]|nr:hypothetical protein [bacterium]